MRRIPSKLLLLAIFTLLAVAPATVAQSPALANLPDADVLIYISPQRLFNDALPKVLPAKDLAEMREGFAQMKTAVGFDPSNVEYLVIAVRFHKPAGDLSFVAPDVMAVAGGDFNAESLLSLAQLSLQDKVRTEKHGAKTIAAMKVDPLVAQAEKMPILKPYTEVGAVVLTPNSIALGTLPYLKAAIDASEGNGRIKPETIQSLMRDPNVLIAATGAPWTAFARSFGLFGTETTPREGRCDSSLGNFYAAITIAGANYSLRGAMNADNPDTAKIITGLLSGLMKQGIDAVPDKSAQTILQTFRMNPKENEIVFEADVPVAMVADMIRSETAPKQATAPAKSTTRKPIRRTKRRG